MSEPKAGEWWACTWFGGLPCLAHLQPDGKWFVIEVDGGWASLEALDWDNGEACETQHIVPQRRIPTAEELADLERERDEARARLGRAETLIRYVAEAEGTDDDMREHVCRCAAAYLEGGEVDFHD